MKKGSIIFSTWGQGHSLLLSKVNHISTVGDIFFLPVTGLIEVKFDMELSWVKRTKIGSNGHGLMTKMAYMPI